MATRPLALRFTPLRPTPMSPLFPYTTLFRSEDLVDHLVRPRLGPVDLVDDDDRLEPQLERLPEDEPRLRHRPLGRVDRKSTRLNSSHEWISYAVFCLKKKNKTLAYSVLRLLM